MGANPKQAIVKINRLAAIATNLDMVSTTNLTKQDIVFIFEQFKKIFKSAALQRF
jgi:hypothetical protein